MKVALNSEEINVLRKIMGNRKLVTQIFTCEECDHFMRHYVLLPNGHYSPMESGHCTNTSSLRLHKANGNTCADFKLTAVQRIG